MFALHVALSVHCWRVHDYCGAMGRHLPCAAFSTHRIVWSFITPVEWFYVIVLATTVFGILWSLLFWFLKAVLLSTLLYSSTQPNDQFLIVTLYIYGVIVNYYIPNHYLSISVYRHAVIFFFSLPYLPVLLCVPHHCITCTYLSLRAPSPLLHMN